MEKPLQVGIEKPEYIESPLKIWASVSRTVNLGNYESLKLDIGITGVPLGSTQEQIQEIMKSADMTFNQVMYSLAAELSSKIEEATSGR